MGYTFARHETFHIRTGWLRKGLNAINKNNHIFLETIEAMEELGLGKNMINSLRYWLVATELTEETYSGNYKIQKPKELAKIIMEYDEYFEDPATYWLIHFNLVRNKEMATTWFWFFNYFNYMEFDKETFIERLVSFIKRTGEEPPAISSLENDFNVLTNMYTYKVNDDSYFLKKKDYDPEKELLKSPFVELRLLMETNDNNLKINRPNLDNLPIKIFYYCFLKTLEKDQTSINVEEILNKENSVGKVFKLNPNLLYQFLERLQELKFIRLDKHAGLNSVTILKEDKKNILKEYYQN